MTTNSPERRGRPESRWAGEGVAGDEGRPDGGGGVPCGGFDRGGGEATMAPRWPAMADAVARGKSGEGGRRLGGMRGGHGRRSAQAGEAVPRGLQRAMVGGASGVGTGPGTGVAWRLAEGERGRHVWPSGFRPAAAGGVFLGFRP